MTVKEAIEGTEPAKDLEQFCLDNYRTKAFERLLSIAEGCNNLRTKNPWVLISAVIAKMTRIVINKLYDFPLEAHLDVNILSNWLIKNIERVRDEKIKEGLPVPERN